MSITDPGDGVTSTITLTIEQADAIIGMDPGDAVALDDGVSAERPDSDPELIWFVGGGVRPCGRRIDLLPKLRKIRNDAADE